MESRLSGRDIGFDAPDDADDDHAPPAPANYLVAHDVDPAEAYGPDSGWGSDLLTSVDPSIWDNTQGWDPSWFDGWE